MFANLTEDLRRYGNPRQQIKALLVAPRVWAIIAYRFGRWVHTTRMPAIVRLPLKMLARLIFVFIDIATNIELPAQTVIGCGIFIPHTGHIIIASNATIGRYCTFTQGISIGHGAGGRETSFAGPVIGDRVFIGPGAAVLGPIRIGNDVLIGANAVVIRSVPDRAVVVGNPARVISFNGSFDLVSYEGMERDPERLAALAAARSEPRGVLAGDSSNSSG